MPSTEIRALQAECKKREIDFHHRNNASTLLKLIGKHDAMPPKPVEMPLEIDDIVKRIKRYNRDWSIQLRKYIEGLLENAR